MSSETIEDRIARWREQDGGGEDEHHVDLLCEAEEELRRLRKALQTIHDAAICRAEAWARDRAVFPHAQHCMSEARALRDIIAENINSKVQP